MRKQESQGRLDLSQPSLLKTVSILSVPVILVFTLGIYLGVKTTETQKDSVEYARMQEVTAQARLLNESFWNSIELVRTKAIALQQLRAASMHSKQLPLPTGSILHWAEIEINGDRVSAVRQTAKNMASKIDWSNFEEKYIQALTEKISLRELRENAVSIVPIKKDEHSSSMDLSLAFASQNTIVAALVDPADLFGAFKRFSSRSEGGTLRAYLVGNNGHVFAHSQQNYVNGNFSGTDVFNQALRALLQGTRVSGAGTYTAIDQQEVTAAYVRPGSVQLGIVVEKLTSAPLSVLGPKGVGIWQRVVGQSLLGITLLTGILLFGALIVRRRFSKTSVKEEKENLVEENFENVFENRIDLFATPVELLNAGIQSVSENKIAPALRDKIIQADSTEESLRRELLAAESALKRIREESSIVNQFEREAANIKDPKAIAYRLTATATRLCGSPTLFFNYHDSVKSAILHSDAGFDDGYTPAGMAFPLEPAVLARVRQADQRGEIASLSDYEPLAHLILARTGVAHFEAWALTGYGQLGRLAGKPRLLGILVILQAGSDTIAKNEAIGRMIRTTGLVYENALLAQ